MAGAPEPELMLQAFLAAFDVTLSRCASTHQHTSEGPPPKAIH